MALPASDSFGAASDPLGSNWTKSADTLKAAAGRCDSASANGGSEAHALWGADAFGNDHYSECKVFNTAGQYGYGPSVRAVITGVPGTVIGLYWVLIDGATSATIYRQPGFNAVGSGFTGLTIVDGDTFRISVTGTTLTLSQNGVSLGTRTDATLSVGSAGLGIYNARGTLDDFVANNVSSGSTYNVSIALAQAAALSQTGPLTIPGSVTIGTRGGLADGQTLGMSGAVTMTGIAALVAQGGFSFVQSIGLALSASVTATMQRGHNLSTALAGTATIADTATTTVAGSTNLNATAGLTAAATEIVNTALALAATSTFNGFAGFSYAGTIGLSGTMSLAASVQRALNLAVTLSDLASASPSTSVDVIASIVASVRAACTASANQALLAQAALGAKAAVSSQAGFSLTAVLQLIVAGQLASSATYISGSGPKTMQIIAEALALAAMQDMGLTLPGITGETIH